MPTPPTLPFVTNARQLGAAVRTAREGLGWSQPRAAARAGVGLRFLRELETGKATVRLDKVLAVTRAHGLQLVVLPGPPPR